MLADLVYNALRPFHFWAQVDAACAVVFAAVTFGLLAVSPRLTRRWWFGLSVLALFLVAVVVGERSRQAAGDLRPIAVACLPPPGESGCEMWALWISAAAQRATLLGIALVVMSALCLIIAIVVIYRGLRNTSGARRLLAERGVGLATALLMAGLGAYLSADGVAGWIQYSYLADITNAGDGIGQIPLISAIFGTVAGGVVLVCGLVFVLLCTSPRIRTVSVPA